MIFDALIARTAFKAVKDFLVKYWEAVLITAIIVGLVFWHNLRVSDAYDDGYKAKEAEIEAAMVKIGQSIARLNGELAAKDAETEAKIEEDRKKRPFRTQYIRETLQNAQEFSAVERPAALSACRLWQLCQIDAAATGGVQREWCDSVRNGCDGPVQPPR